MRLRLDAVVREKCGGMARAPFRWYETAPLLLQKGSVETLIAMARQADASLQRGIRAAARADRHRHHRRLCRRSAGPATRTITRVGQAMMNVLKAVAQTIGCFVLGVDHFGKDMLSRHPRRLLQGELAAIWCWPAWAIRSSAAASPIHGWPCASTGAAGRGRNTRSRCAMVEAPEPDEDGEPITTMVVDWLPAGAGAGAQAQPELDPWLEGCRRQDQRTVCYGSNECFMKHWPSTESNCQSSRTVRRCGWSHRRSSGSGFMPARQLMKALQSKSDKFGTRSSKRLWIERRSES